MAVTTEELSARLQRIYAAIGAVIDKQATATFKPKVELAPDGYLQSAEWSFGAGVPAAESQIIAWTAIHNTAMFYDHCLHWAQSNGVAADEVHAVTANCLALRIIRDLYNSDKHPQGRPNTSGLSPKLRDARCVLRITANQCTRCSA